MNTIAHRIDKHAVFQPEKAALIYEGRTVSYAELAQRSTAAARMLKHQLGVGPGDRVAYLGYNSPELLILLLACARLGALFLPLDWRLADGEPVSILKNAAPRVLVVEADFRGPAEGCREDLPDCEFVASRFESSRTADFWRPMAQLTAAAQGDAGNPHVDDTSPLLLAYTPVAAGRRNGAVLTQRALAYNALNSQHMHDLCARDLVLAVQPMSHVDGLNIQTLPALYVGASVILHPRFDPAETLACIRAHKPSLLALEPAAAQALIECDEWEESDIGCLRMLTSGYGHVSMPLIEAFHARGVPVIQVYGSAEAGPVAVYQRKEDAWTAAGSVGKAGLYNEIRVVGAQGDILPAGKAGEVLIRGGNLFSEYWGDDEATAEAFRDGWVRTGDVGYLDTRGDLWITDRA